MSLTDALYFSNVPPPGEATIKGSPFTLTLSSGTTGDHYIALYSQFSRSRPYQNPQSKWGHLLPQWQFEDINNNVTNFVKTTDTVIYSSGVPIGTTGIAQFYYIDDMPTANTTPVVIWATLQTSAVAFAQDNEKQNLPGYANSQVIAARPYYINGTCPEYLEITRNGITNINTTKWADVEFPYVITLKGSYNGCEDDTISDITIFDYPGSNAAGALPANEINRSIIDVTSNSNLTGVTWTPADQFFQRYDKNGFEIGGFVRGSVISTLSSEQAAITASAQVQYAPNNRVTPFVWISNPENNTLNNIEYYAALPQSVIDAITSVPLPLPENAALEFEQFDTPFITEINLTNAWSYSGYGGIFGIAMDNCFNVWTTDAEMDRIYKFTNDGTLVSSISVADGSTPAGIALDADLNIWVTLFDSVSTLKYDSDGNLLFVTSPGYQLDSLATSFASGNSLFKPPAVATDTSSNAWVTYSNPFSSALVKYDPDGNILVSASIVTSSTPMDIIVDSDDSIWVTHAYSHIDSLGTVEKYDSNGNNLSSFSVPQPGYITLDNDHRPWFTYGYNNVGYIDNGVLSSFSVSANQVLSAINFDPMNVALEGIASDYINRIWVINSVENIAYVISAGNISSFDSFEILPDANQGWYIDGPVPSGNYVEFTDPLLKSAQAFGDWTGTRWLRTYVCPTTGTTITKTVTGISNEFQLLPFDNPYYVRKQNESWDAAEQIRSYALADHTFANEILWTDLIGQALGGLENGEESLDREAYEKIANFVENHVDVEECEIPQLYSLAQELDIPIDDYNLSPTELHRIMNIVSINHQDLWGARCKCNRNFGEGVGNTCANCDHEHNRNLGEEFSPLSYTVTANVPFVVKSKFGDQYHLLNPVEVDYITPIQRKFTGELIENSTFTSGLSTWFPGQSISLAPIWVPSQNTYPSDPPGAGQFSGAASGPLGRHLGFPYQNEKYPNDSLFIAGCSYRLRFDAGAYKLPSSTPQSLSIYVGGTRIEGLAVTPPIPGGVLFYYTRWPAVTQYDYTFVAPNSGQLKFLQKPGFGAGVLDNISLSGTTLQTFAQSGIYPLSATPSISWLTSADYGNYHFYNYIDAFCNDQVEGVINWEDEYTTLMESNSTLSAWYGSNGIVETMFNYTLHKGLGLEE